MDSGSTLQLGVTATVLLVCSWGLSQWDYPDRTTSCPEHRPARYPVCMPSLLTAFSICTGVIASAGRAKQISELCSMSRSINVHGGLRESSEKTPLPVTRPWCYHHRKFSSNQIAQRCIKQSVVREEHNYTTGGKQIYFLLSQTHSVCALPVPETALLSRHSAAGHDSSGINSAGNLYFS